MHPISTHEIKHSILFTVRTDWQKNLKLSLTFYLPCTLITLPGALVIQVISRTAPFGITVSLVKFLVQSERQDNEGVGI